MLYRIGKIITVLLLKVFFRLEVKGQEYIPANGGFILASNHLSYLDPFVLGAACRRKLTYMARDSLFNNPILSWLLSKVNTFPIRRNSPDSSALKQGIAKLKGGGALVIFPEGSRQREGLSKVAQPGIAFLAVKSASPIIPSFIKGTDLALPKGARFIRPKKISVYFGKEIPIERSKSHNYQDIANEVMCVIGHLACK